MGADIDNFNWRLEEACLNAWPAETSVLYDGWLVRCSGGPIRRSNSVNPLRGPRGTPEAVIGFAERSYGEPGQNAIFRIPEIAPDLDGALAARGYVVDAPTSTLFADLSGRSSTGDTDPDVRLAAAPSRLWLEARSRFSGSGAADRDIYATMTRLLRVPACFAGIEADGTIVAQAYAAMHRGVVVMNSVATDPDYRKRGLGRRVVGALLDWGRRAGAETGGLQVVSDNVPALALYRSVGFTRLAYSYHYRIRR